MTPERAQQFLEDLHQAGWSIHLGHRYASAVHFTWGGAVGRSENDKLPEMLDDLREQLRKRELCE